MTASLEINDVRPTAFDRFVDDTGVRLRRALVAHFGIDVGLEVTADALAHAWEHWDEVQTMANPTGYLYRVAQSSPAAPDGAEPGRAWWRRRPRSVR